MKHLAGKATLIAPPLVFGSGAWAQQVARPTDHCQDHTSFHIVTFADPVLENAVRAALSLGPTESLSCGRAAQLTRLDASGPGRRLEDPS